MTRREFLSLGAVVPFLRRPARREAAAPQCPALRYASGKWPADVWYNCQLRDRHRGPHVDYGGVAFARAERWSEAVLEATREGGAA